jgi:hypothetical protein
MIESFHPKVLLVIYNPKIHSSGNRKLSELLGWNNVDILVETFIEDLRKSSFGICNYQISEKIVIDGFPVKEDGFRYSADQYVNAWRAGKGFHKPDWADYHQILREVGGIERINSGTIDEIWLFAFPYGGFYESRMAGPGAFWCNAPPLVSRASVSKRFVIMGFNYERGVGEMLESFGHRAESIMAHVYRNQHGEANLWKRFIRTDLTHTGQAEVGTIHFAPNSRRDYDWGNKLMVPSRCDTWYNFPNLDGQTKMVDCSEWGNGEIRNHHRWWLKHFPHTAGSLHDISHNWWEYVVDPNRS